MDLDCKEVNERLRSLERYAKILSDADSNEKARYHRKKSNLKVKYNMSLRDHSEKVKSQNNKCAICGEGFGGTKKSMPHVDHCHETGQIRDLLCLKCNAALGYINEDLQIAHNMIEYIKKWNQ